MMHKKSILLLGGSAQQLVAIRAAKELGYHTVLCDYLPDNPGQYESDVYYNVSTTDIEAVYNIALQEKIEGILAYASDPAALPAAIICERLGLPTNPSESVKILGIKHEFRRFLRRNGFACPQTYSFNPSQDIEEIKEAVKGFRFPIVVKPTDSSGSKGVSMLETFKGLEKAIEWADSYSRNKILLIEEFITRGFPYVIGGDIFISGGRIVLFGEMSCLRGRGGDGLIPIGERWPSGLNALQTERVHTELQRIVTALGVKFGEMNIEILLDNDDKVHFLELGPRAGGNMIPLQLSDAFRVDFVKANVLVAMGEDVDLKAEMPEGCFMTYVIHSYEEGELKEVEYDPEITPYIYRKVIYKKPGDKVEFFDGAGKAVGIIFLNCPTEEEMLAVWDRMESLVKVKLKP